MRILTFGAKDRWKNLHRHPGNPFQIRPGPGYFSIARMNDKLPTTESIKLVG